MIVSTHLLSTSVSLMICSIFGTTSSDICSTDSNWADSNSCIDCPSGSFSVSLKVILYISFVNGFIGSRKWREQWTLTKIFGSTLRTVSSLNSRIRFGRLYTTLSFCVVVLRTIITIVEIWSYLYLSGANRYKALSISFKFSGTVYFSISSLLLFTISYIQTDMQTLL